MLSNTVQVGLVRAKYVLPLKNVEILTKDYKILFTISPCENGQKKIIHSKLIRSTKKRSTAKF